MQNGLRPISIVTGLLFVLAFPVSGLAGTGSTAPTPTGSTLGKTTATIVGDAVQFRPCSFEATFAVDAPDNNFSLFQKASGDFPTYHSISGLALLAEKSTCDNRVWTSTVWAVDEEGTSGEASDALTFECRIDRDDIPTDPIFSGETQQPRYFGASQSQPPDMSGTAAVSCCFNITLSSSTPGGERDLDFEMVSGDLPPGHRLSGDTIRGCTSDPTYISGDYMYGPRTWTSKWITTNNRNRCEESGQSTLTLTCGSPF